MKPQQVIIAFAVVAFAAIMYYTMFSGAGEQEYVAKVMQARDDRDDFMTNSDESPFANDTIPFNGLKYFPADPKFRVTADLTLIEEKKVVVLPTSDGKEARYLEYAYADFELEGVNNRLVLLEVMDMGPLRGTLFLPFADQTSALDTYGAGRYLDVKKTPGAATITLDFNLAYNPYCAYSNKYSCPFPPRENMLAVIVAAGEKVYRE
jgi:uncharacterized protein (DUF1684 family)